MSDENKLPFDSKYRGEEIDRGVDRAMQSVTSINNSLILNIEGNLQLKAKDLSDLADETKKVLKSMGIEYR